VSRRGFGPIVLVGMVLFAIAVYPRLPAEIPTHWGLNGEVNGTMPKFPGAFLLPGIAFIIWLALPALRQIDPREEHYEKFSETFWIVVNLAVLVMALIEVLSLGYALGWPVDMGRAIPALVGVLFVAIGNYLPRLRSNWWMGIRTPWTMSSERVWRETHRMAGPVFVIGGLVCLASVFTPSPVRLALPILALLVATMIPIVYSYVVWRREAERHS
jgi:uncharacterized membrane protein